MPNASGQIWGFVNKRNALGADHLSPSVRTSVRCLVSATIPFGGFSLNLVLVFFRETYRSSVSLTTMNTGEGILS